MLKEAQRCLQCKKPRCQTACPVSTEIPRVIDSYLQGDVSTAGRILFENNPLSVITSLVCPHEKQCQGNCILGQKGLALNIGEIEHMVSLNFLKQTSFTIPKQNNSMVAIVGSGPAGLTIAFLLAQKGYRVTIFEENDKTGGVLRFGIPEFRLSKQIIDLLAEKLLELGVIIRYNTLIGPVLTLEDLFRDGYLAVFIGTGVWRSNKLGLKGESLGNVHFAIDYLKNPDVYRLGAVVNVVGAGNVAIDVARTAIRKGAIRVSVLYRGNEETMTANKGEIEMAKAEGVSFLFFLQPVEFLKDGVLCHKTLTKAGKIVQLPETEFIKSDSVIISVGQGPRANIVATAKNLEISARGLIKTDSFGKTSMDGVFASGDVVTGARTVVEAVNIARRVAGEMEKYMISRRKYVNI
ncbi:MAG: dihydropyrimidine dehydrogenase [Peptococcaceae bacterium BICA1-8]|nr:MAG: dihydropyrimidine dehydrogenase [Peptococcaceae bacterium BICA1-8]